jgi:GNAT superfamily N-acetyltransferase
MDADLAAAALLEVWNHLGTHVPGMWSRRVDGAVATVTGVPASPLNGVWVGGACDSAVITELLDEVAASGLPHVLQARPEVAPQLAEVAAARGMSAQPAVPLMVLSDASSLAGARTSDGLAIRELEPSEAAAHASVAAAGFEIPDDLLRQLVTPALLSLASCRAYVGEIDGTPVSTGMSITLEGATGVFNIATPPARRRRGYGAAVTARVVDDGLAAGASWAWLQASTAGYTVYERLGFRALARWSCWGSPS